MRKNGKIVQCNTCGKKFYLPKVFLKKRNYCSNSCYGKYRKNKPLTKEHKRKISIGNKNKIRPPVSKKTRTKISKSLQGKRGPQARNWQGGILIHQGKYIIIFNPSHPFCDKKGYVRKHRLVMEKHLGRYLTKKEVVHHINGNPSDNKLSNLILFPNNAKHRESHKI